MTLQFLCILLVVASIVLTNIFVTAVAQDNKKDPNRTITGTVVDDKENPISGAVVYLKNTRNLSVKSYITEAKGTYRFTGLSPNADFEVYAEFKDKRSATKTFSVFDGRKLADFTLKIGK